MRILIDRKSGSLVLVAVRQLFEQRDLASVVFRRRCQQVRSRCHCAHMEHPKSARYATDSKPRQKPPIPLNRSSTYMAIRFMMWEPHRSAAPVTVQSVKEFLGLSAGPSQKIGEQFLDTILSNFLTNTVEVSCNAVAMNSARLVNG